MQQIQFKSIGGEPIARLSAKLLRTPELLRQAHELLHQAGGLPVEWQEEIVHRLSLLSEQLYDARLIPK